MPKVRRQPITYVQARRHPAPPPKRPPSPQPRLGIALRLRSGNLPPPRASTPPRNHPPELRRRSPQRSCDIKCIAHPRPRPPQRPPLRRLPHQNHVRHHPSPGHLPCIAACQHHPRTIRQPAKSIQEPVQPTSFRRVFHGGRGQTQGHKCRHRVRAHRRYVTQSTGKTPVPNRLGSMEIPPEVPPLQQQVRRHHYLPPQSRSQHGAVVPNAQLHPARTPSPRKPAPYAVDQLQLRPPSSSSPHTSRQHTPGEFRHTSHPGSPPSRPAVLEPARKFAPGMPVR